MARSSLRDPLDKFRWIVSIDEFTKSGFQNTSTPGHKLTTNKYAEGGSHLNPRSIIDGNEFKPVVLTVGVTTDTSFAKWASGPFDLVQNNAALNKTGSAFGIIDIPPGVQQLGFGGPALIKSANAYPFTYRRDVTIKHINRLGVAEIVYTLYKAFVVEYEPASDFTAEEDDKVSIASLTLGYDGYDVRYASAAGLAQNILLG
jgi:phage tail-like protein